jgi:hypothetical protein
MWTSAPPLTTGATRCGGGKIRIQKFDRIHARLKGHGQ